MSPDARTAYERALARLLSSPTRPKLGLERMRALLARLDNPERALRVIHVAGTKGKGSTCAFIEAIVRAHGLRTGLTTSPHLCTARERIAVDGTMIDEATFAALEARVRAGADAPVARATGGAGGALEVSFFEQMIAMAFLHFRDVGVDVAVVEVGLGGRLDATNVCAPAACALTRIGIDHVEHLGPTLAGIAREKAGILKPGVNAVSSPQEPEAAYELRERAREVSAPLRFVEVDDTLTPSLAGAHQQQNASVAVAAVHAAGLRVDDAVARRAVASTVWPGRYETLSTGPLLVVDGAHNETGAQALAAVAAADARRAGPLCLIVAMTMGKDPAAFGRALAPLAPARTFAVPAGSPRSMSPGELARALSRGLGVAEPATLEEALARTGGRDTLVCGSLYVVGQVRHRILGVPMDPAFPLF